MKKIKLYLAIALLAVISFAACTEEEKIATIPEMSGVVVPTDACFGDSIVFKATITDKTPLSTLKARLYFGDELISETVIRTKEFGEYTGKILAPYYPNIPNGTATMTLTAQNIEFGLVEQTFQIAVTRPDYEYLMLIAEDGSEYKMEKTELYQYKYSGVLPQTFKAYIAAPELTSTDIEKGRNRLTWGSNLGTIAVGSTGFIKFINSTAGNYDVTFNILNYESAPFENPISFGGAGMEIISDTQMKVEMEITQNQVLEVEGFNLEELWVDSDFFEVNSGTSATFLPMSGKYRVTLDSGLKSLTAEAMNGSELSTFADGGSLWLIGWGIGKPNPTDNNINWDPGKGLCMAKIDEGVFSVTLKFVQGWDMKLFHQKGWGGEYGFSAYSSYQSDMVKITDGGNFQGLDDNPLDFTKEYVLTINTTGGEGNITMALEEKGGGGDDDQTLKFAGLKMSPVNGSEVEFRVETRLTQGQTIKTNGVDLSTLWIDPDYFIQSGPKTLKFVPMDGKYRITLNTELGYYCVEAMNGDDLSQFTDGGSMWLIGWGIGKPDPAVLNVNWDTNNGLCMAKIGDGKYQITTKLLPVTEQDKFSFKFFHQKGWGGELLGPAFTSYQSDVVVMTDSGNFEPLAGYSYDADKFYTITLDVSAGVDAAVMTMSTYAAANTFAGSAFVDNVVEVDLQQKQNIMVSGIDTKALWTDPDYFTLNDDGTLTFLPVSGKYRVTYMEASKYFRVERMNGDALATYADGTAIWMIGGKVGKPTAEGDDNVSWNTDRGICMAEISKGVFRCTFKLIPDMGDTSFKFFHQKGWGGEFGSASSYASYQDDLVKLSDSGNFDQLDPNPISGDKFYTVTIDAAGGEGTLKMTMVEN